MKKGIIKRILIPTLIIIIVIVGAIVALTLSSDYKQKQEFSALPAAVLHTGFCEQTADYDVKAMQYFVYSVTDNKMICQKGAEKVIYPASTTKLVTALTALEYLSPDDIVTAGEETGFIPSGSSIAYIKSGMSLSVEMLIEGMMLPSGNDAAYVLAAAAGRKIADNDSLCAEDAVAVFVVEMNRFADKIGMCGSNFISPDGYCGDEHYSTVEDMAIISAMALNNDVISKYASLYSDDVVYASGETNQWISTNECLNKASDYYNDKITGLKTGSLDNYYNFIASATDGNDTYIIGVFGLKNKADRFADVNKIASELFK